MRIEHEGISLWYGTPDAPAPSDVVSAGSTITVTVGVYPADASNIVEIRYRVNQGAIVTIPARYFQKGRDLRSQYFRASLPAFNPGDTVDYFPVCRCAGRQVPADATIEEFTSSFSVVEAGVKGGGDRSNLKNKATPATDQSTSTRTSPQGTPPQDLTPRDQSTPLRLSTRKKTHLKNLTLGITEPKRKEKLDQLFIETEGEFSKFKARLEESEEFNAETIQRLTFNHEVAELLEDRENWVATFAQNNHIHNLRDLALNYRKQDFKSLIRTAGIPKATEAEDEEECLERCAARVSDRLFRMEPTAVIHRMVRDEEISADDQNIRHGLLSFFNNQPNLDFRKTSVLQVLQNPDSLKQVPEAHREQVVDRLKKLQRLSALSPRAEAMPTLMKTNLTSAYAINEVPMERFVSLFAERLGGQDVARAVHHNAQTITARNEHAYISLRQAVLGVPVRMIHGELSVDARKAAAVAVAQQKNIPINFETLFGSVDLCECAHCNSVYSPAAYLVELFQYLRNNNLDLENDNTGKAGFINTPLDMFFRRRPDLGHLQLTCENTNTLIPYIDLVNEVMEGFVRTLGRYENDTENPKRAMITSYNVKDESSSLLLAEPQNTNYYSYLILSKTVYPVCKLPYHQPIDAIRLYLNYLGTSRYELFDTFRADVPIQAGENAMRMQELQVQSVDRAIAAEFLHLTEEEYVILTKEGFHTEEWYELKEETNLSLSEYQEKIGLKDTWDYYGIGNESQMLEELKWVKPAQETGIVGFLRRTNIKYVDLIELLKTRYINPNYLSGKALAYMNSLRFSYRYLQTLVDESQIDISLKYKQLVQLLQDTLVPPYSDDFDKNYVECWVYKYFTKIGKVIVLENASSCQCIEGTIRLAGRRSGESNISFVSLYLDKECQIHILKTTPKQYLGHLDTATGKLILDNDFAQDFIITSGDFFGLNGEVGKVLQNLVLEIDYKPFICTNYQENCDLTKTQLKHLDGTDLITSEYDRFHRFIRLWCKLGWAIEEVDQAIVGVGEARAKPPIGVSGSLTTNKFVALMPSGNFEKENEFALRERDNILTANPRPIKPEDDCKPEPISQVIQDITPYLIEQLVAVKKLLEITGLELAQLLTYWTHIGVYGENSLYKRLFLKYNLIAVDDVFKEELGTYLSKAGTPFSDHLPVLMAALKVDVNMIETIMSLVAIPDELTLDNVSKLYRHILLAKTLGLRVKELPSVLALMKGLSQPFGEPTQTLKFYDLFARIENSNFSPRELNYLLHDEDDSQRPLRPSMAKIFQLAIALRDALLQIEIDHADIKDEQEATEELLRSKLSLLYDGAIVEQIIALVQGTTVYLDNTRRKFSTRLNDTDQKAITDFLLIQRKNEEKQPDGEFQTFLQRVQFSGTKGLQITGILSDSDRNKVIALTDQISDSDDKENFLIVANKMFGQSEQFFKDTLAPIFADPDAAKEVLLAEDRVNTENPEEDSGFKKRVYLTSHFMPYLREMLRQRLIVQMLASNLGVSLDITQTLVMEVIQTQAGEPLYQEIIRLKDQKDPEAEAQRWQGFFVPEKDGKYTFLLEAEGEASLTFNNQSQWSAPERTDEEQINFYQTNFYQTATDTVPQRSIFLKAGQAYSFILKGYDEDENGNIIGLFMKFNDQAQVKLSDKVLFPALRTEAFRSAYIRLQKAAMVVKGFAMKLEEMEFFRKFSANFAGVDFNFLTFPQWLRLEAFYRLKKSLSPTELSLVEFLRWTNQTQDAVGEPSLIAQIHALTGWDESDIYKMILPQHFNLSHPEHFRDDRNLLKLQETLRVAKKIGVGMGDLFQWGQPTSNFTGNRRIASNIQQTIRARYSQEEWEEAIKSTHDRLRENQKQALIAYLLAQPILMEWGVRDADSLFEFFLIDVQMDACMETSRIKQAISSVQLFVQRCFLGLEAKYRVPSEVLDRDRWEWMQRYRVWEANRKVFLYPENWIRPELRDVKSPFFQELESELLQNDVSNETVTTALKKYFIQVDEVSNLEVIGHYLDGDEVNGKIHVFARTRNAPYFFYYRYYDYKYKDWYPWEKVEIDIPSIDVENEQGEIVSNGSFVIPVVWNNRLFIFFPQFMKKNWTSSLANQQSIIDSAENRKMEDSVPISYWEIKLGWSEYKNGKWTPKNLSNQAISSLQPTSFGFQWSFINPEKFIFASFSDNNLIKIQIYYSGDIISFFEELSEDKNGNLTYFFSREPAKFINIQILPLSFRFNGDSITTDEIVSSFVPAIFGFFSFHYASFFGDNEIISLQAKDDEADPTANYYPAFSRNSDSSRISFSNSEGYIFAHPLTKKLLGQLFKGNLTWVFKEGIPLSPDNYGSNDGLQYHELKRPYAIYNWEALFHSVALLADHLTKSQRFEEAMQWWHYIFNPIAVQDDINKVWQFCPFQKTDSKNVLEQILNSLDPNAPDNSFNNSIENWRENPFQPHLIARDRPTAYMKWVVMKYIDNLIAWGDYLFRQDTIETLNQATQLYVLAGHILGPRPEFIPKRGKVQPASYLDLVDEWDAFSNAMRDMELIFPSSNQIAVPEVDFDGKPHYVNIYGFATTLYFCIPDNPKLLEYWDTVADRLFKIRHCLNIEGVFRKLSLFEPPIDPALLVQAAAQGLSISSVLNDLSTPMPNYRFNYLLQRALEVTSEVKSLGSALLSALEKKDGESLSILRAQHDTRMQNLIMEVRNQQLEEAKASLVSLEQNRKAPEHRLQYYLQLVGEEVNVPTVDVDFTELANPMPEVKEDGGLKLIPPEAEEIKKAKQSADLQTAVGVLEALAGHLHLIPTFAADVKPFGVGAGTEYGGSNIATAVQASAQVLQIGVNRTSFQSSAAARKAGFTRQQQDRIFQANLAGHELMQIDKQITAQKIRRDLAQLEIDNHQIQIEQTQEVEDFIRNKYSNEQLYQWMSDRLKDLYYQAYSFAYDLAKKAEKVFRFEMGLSTSDFIKFGYWDSAKDGFLAGEQLYLALKHLENAYVETKLHDYEITKHISLQQSNPLVLIQLKETGVCEFDIPEESFDLDYPGHYKRRIKTVSVSIPCVVGPYTSLNCTLRLLKHEYRNSKIAANASDYAKKLEEADERFVYNPIPTTAIAISQGQNDSGVFELNFRDERYMPFEGAGAISSWRLELPQDFHQFDYQTITDVIIHLRYTSCEGGTTLKTAAIDHLKEYVQNAAELSKREGLFRMLSLKHEFPDEWYRFLHPEPDVTNQVFVLGNLKERLPFFANSQKVSGLQVQSVMLFAPIEGLTVSLLRSDQAENLYTDNVEPITVLEN
ncbi:MAG: Tc toxin subunit A, partial [Coleofasciculus sp. S288]|nr:Tc toxin subunit A [Coleofasciculus sp. S288]